MAYNTVQIKKDLDGKPIPQYYNQLTNEYEVLQGRNGANKVELYDADGNAVDLEALLTAIVTALGQVVISSSALPAGAATEVKQDTLISHVDGVEGALSTIQGLVATAAKQDTIKSAIDSLITILTTVRDSAGIKKITDPLPAGTNNIGKVDVNSSALPTGAATSAKQDTIISHVDGIEGALSTLNSKDFATQTTLAAILTLLTTMNNKDATKTLYGLSTDVKPTSGNTKGDKYFEINTGEVYMWNGSSWVVI